MTHEFVKYLKAFNDKQFLIAEGAVDEDFFCLINGKVSIWKGDVQEPDSLIRVGEINEQGAYFGEMSYFLKEVRTASIRAEGTVKALKFPGEMLQELIMKQPALGFKICSAMASRLKGTTSKTQEVTLSRNEVRGDATDQLLHGKESYKKVFMLLTAIQSQFQNPLLKSVIEYMKPNKLLQGGRKQRITKDFTRDLPDKLTELLHRAFD